MSDSVWINDLITKASEAKQHSYNRYSKFRVGSALLCTDGTIYTGCNVENASYPVGVCAERTAICKAVSEGRREFKAIAVITDVEKAVSPCGMCRQTIREFNIGKIFCAKATPIDGKYVYCEFTLEQLLPHSFGPENLQQHE